MSEALAGIEWTPPVVALRPAAAVILVRGLTAADREVLWVRRGGQLGFSGGFYAFPGGKVDAADHALPVAGAAAGMAPFHAAAIRETFEEVGILLARGAELLDPALRADLRRELLAGASFAALLARAGLRLEAWPLVEAGRWVTPPFSPVRFDARFFLAVVPEGTAASIAPGELSGGGWIHPAQAIAAWERGEVLLHPPTQHALATLAGFAPEAAVARLRRPPHLDAEDVSERIEFQRGVLLVALRTPTLPPAQHTNCYVLGTGELLVVDPGSPWPEEQQRLARILGQLQGEGRRVLAVALTHAHGDHTGGVAALARDLGVPVWAHEAVAARVPGAQGCLRDGDRLELDGPMPMRWRAVLTPGHAHGHLCFLDEGSRALLAGDMVAGGSSIVIDPPEGDLGAYLASLRRLLELGIGALYPAHGLAIPDGPGKLAEYIEHRERRLEAVAAAVAGGARAPAEVVEQVYTDTPRWLHPAAQRSALASLLELVRRGRVARTGEEFSSAPPSPRSG